MSVHRLDGRQLSEKGWFTREHGLIVVLIVATALAFVLCYLLLQPFVAVIAWALALAIIARPLHDWLARHVKHADVAAGMAVVLVAVVIIVPALFVVGTLLGEVRSGVAMVKSEKDVMEGTWMQNLEAMPGIGEHAQWIRENVDVNGTLEQAIGPLTGLFSQVITGSVWAMIQLLLVLFTLFFFFRDRGRALRGLRGLMPLSEKETDEVFQRVADTVHATVYGSLVCAFIQGALGGLIFWMLDLPAPVLWGVIMSLLAVIPNLGAFVIWMPAALILALSGDQTRALILFAWGAIAIGLIDNLLYPYLVGHRMRLHTLLVFFAVLGGIVVFGASGIVLGPVILAVTMALVDVWRRRTSRGKAAEQGVSEPQCLVAKAQ